MKRYKLFMLTVLLLVCDLLCAQTDSSKGARIEFSSEKFDFGTLKYGADGRCFFEFTNTGNTPLVIFGVKGSGSRVAHHWKYECIQPGKTARIEACLYTKLAGPFIGSLTVQSNAVNEPAVVLIIKADILEMVEDNVPKITEN